MNSNMNNKSHVKNDHILTLTGQIFLVSAISIFMSMSFLIVALIIIIRYTNFIAIYINLEDGASLAKNDGFDESVVISPARWLAACVIPIMIAFYGYREKSLSFSGALFGFLMGFVLTLSNFCFLATLFTFLMSSSKATKFRPHLKIKIEEDLKLGDMRSLAYVFLNNGGPAIQLGILYLIDVGASEKPIDFLNFYRASWLSMGILGMFSFCNGDTLATELGTVLAKSEPFLITTLKRVPPGTNGGVTVVGTFFSIVGGTVIGISQYLAIFYFSEKAAWDNAPPQWPIILFGALSGFLGSLIDSFMGATLQYSGLDKDGKIVAHSSKTVKHISGRNILRNYDVNLITTVIMGHLMPTISKTLWPIICYR